MAQTAYTNATHSQVLGIRRVYAAMCAEADAFVGSVLDALETTGLGDNTFTVFWSDHGELAMDHASWCVNVPDLPQYVRLDLPCVIVIAAPLQMLSSRLEPHKPPWARHTCVSPWPGTLSQLVCLFGASQQVQNVTV